MKNDSSTTFASLALCEALQRAISEKGYTSPSPIQARAIPYLLEGRDLIGLAQTGTGKTAAFSLPLLNYLNRVQVTRVAKRPRALILTPTRELAIQIAENIAGYGRHLRLRHTLMFGGVGEQPQIKSVAVGTDILIATPGRLLDLMSQRHVFLDKIEVFVLDEADRMLDMGFAPDVKRIVAQIPAKRQSLLFSATMPDSIRQLASSLLNNPAIVEVAPVGTTVDLVEQKVCFVPKTNKHKLLVHILADYQGQRVLVFSRTKHGADRLARNLVRDGIRADAIHGDRSQGARQRALRNFTEGSVPVLVATDIAARGIDVKEVSVVVNYDLPEEPEAYVHRIGRTARAGASGMAIAFCDHEEKSLLRDIQRLTRKTIPVDRAHPYADKADEDLRPQAQPLNPQFQRSQELRHGRTNSGAQHPGQSQTRQTGASPAAPAPGHHHPRPLHRGSHPLRQQARR